MPTSGDPVTGASRLRRWLAIGVAALVLGAVPARAAVEEATSAQILVAADRKPPPATAAWQPVELPDLWRKSRPEAVPQPSWYRIVFRYPAGPDAPPWAVLFPYFYDGGAVWLNGALVKRIAENSAEESVRWARPHLVSLPTSLLREGDNELLVRAAQPPPAFTMRMPRVRIGPEHELTPLHDHRLFWVRTTPEIATIVCLLLSACMLFIWWRRRGDPVYGLFGLAVGLWGIRTLTFVFEVVPAPMYLWWRLAYHTATGGFVVVMLLLALRLAGLRFPRLEGAVLLYWLAGPLWLLVGGVPAEPAVNRFWSAGLLPVGVGIMAVSVWSLLRQRTFAAALLPLGMIVGVLAGVHDYVISWDLDALVGLPQAWALQRIYLLHHAANLILLAIGGLLTSRFVDAIRAQEDLTHSLELRVAERERELAANYLRVAALERDQAAEQERQRIMREIHDGLGSNLLVSLSRVERGDMERAEIAFALRACIADLRIALDSLSPHAGDFRSAFGDLMFRWHGELQSAGIRLGWSIDAPDESLQLSPHSALHLLRVVQEALTNTLKHAKATEVHVALAVKQEQLVVQVRDNGVSRSELPTARGHGLRNMQSRIAQLGGALELGSDSGGMQVTARIPLAGARA